MLIPIRSEDNADPPSWAMIELQGEIDRKLPSIDSRNDSLDDVGTLTASSSGAVFLTIGHHQLEGSVVPLKKPLAVLQKIVEEGICGQRAEGRDCEDQQHERSGSVSYKLVGIVREKYHFKTRPRALISRPTSASRRK